MYIFTIWLRFGDINKTFAYLARQAWVWEHFEKLDSVEFGFWIAVSSRIELPKIPVCHKTTMFDNNTVIAAWLKDLKLDWMTACIYHDF